jgi:predicted enzyme related to lactoylglutathione lyase
MVDSGGSKVGHILSARSVIVVTAESQPRCRDQCEERFMASGMKLVVYPVADLAQAKALYGQLLGVAPYVDAPYYVGFRVGDQEVGLDPHGHAKGMAGPIGYWQVGDIEASLNRLVAAGATVQQATSDVGGGKLIAWVKDADGNLTGLIQMPQAS